MLNEKTDKQATNPVELDEKERLAIKKAEIYTNSVKSAALSINDIHRNKIEITTLVENLQKQVDDVLNGSVGNIESILLTQAQTLNVLFHQMITKMMNESCYPGKEMFSNIALKAQNQCRQTLAVLGDLKRPQQTTVVQQQNLALNQQVNNSVQASEAKGLTKPANELLEVVNESVDARKAFAPIEIDFQMETLDEIYGGEN